KVAEGSIKPTVGGIQEENMAFIGFIFLGLMQYYSGYPDMIVYNARIQALDCDVVWPRIQSDLLELLEAAADQRLEDVKVKIDSQSAATVMLVSGGYPESFEKGKLISGIDSVKDSIVYHAGTKLEKGELLTNGGRVL